MIVVYMEAMEAGCHQDETENTESYLLFMVGGRQEGSLWGPSEEVGMV